MSIALARAHPHLKACVLDFDLVCAATRSIIRRERMSRRVTTLVGDMNAAIPSGFDAVMFWGIGHIEARVMRMTYESLPKGGMVVLSCHPSPKPGAPAPNRFLHEYLSVRPPGQSKPYMLSALETAGFEAVSYRSIGRGLGMITGLKRR
jgi:hypothetical protein